MAKNTTNRGRLARRLVPVTGLSYAHVLDRLRRFDGSVDPDDAASVEAFLAATARREKGPSTQPPGRPCFVESGEGDRLSAELDEAAARSLARELGERLVAVGDPDEDEEDWLVWDYHDNRHGTVDDVGARRCDTCRTWVDEDGTDPCGDETCFRCGGPIGADYHLVGAADEPTYCCDGCWDERLR